MVLVRDGRAEQRHDAVAGVLVDGALEAVDAVGEDLEEALEDSVPGLGARLLGQLQGALDVGEQDGDLFALAFERGPRLQDALGEVLRRVVPRRAGGRRVPFGAGRCRAGPRPALAAELRGRRQLAATARAARGQRRPALEAELRALGVRVAAAGTAQGVPSGRPVGPRAFHSAGPGPFRSERSCGAARRSCYDPPRHEPGYTQLSSVSPGEPPGGAILRRLWHAAGAPLRGLRRRAARTGPLL